jgi:aminotransferase
VSKDSTVARGLKRIEPSGTSSLFSVAQRFPSVINLAIGEPDFTPPAHVINAAKQALNEGKTHYVPSAGMPRLCEAIAEKARNDYNLEYDPNNEVLVTVGATEAVFLALKAISSPGDEVLLLDPSFICYEPDVFLTGGKPIHVPMRKRDGFGLDVETVMSHITKRSRVIIINSPNNPTGAVFSHDDLLKLSRLAAERDLVVISDEVYEKIVYDDAKHFCLATFPGMRERTIVVNSFSKTYAMTGFRVGYAVGPPELIAPMLKIHQYSIACVDGIAQYAAIAALEGSQDFVRTMVTEFAGGRKLMYDRINELEGLECVLPKGAFYIFADIHRLRRSSTDFSDYLLDDGKVAVAPGRAFGKAGEGYIRLSYATAYEKIQEAMDRIEKSVRKL